MKAGADCQHHAIVGPSHVLDHISPADLVLLLLRHSLKYFRSLDCLSLICSKPVHSITNRLHLLSEQLIPIESRPWPYTLQTDIQYLCRNLAMKIFASLLALTAVTAVAAPANEIRRRDLAADDAPHQDDPNLISAVMRAHWYWRRLHCAQDLVWDTELANAARADISECPKDPEHVSSGHGNDRAWLIFVETLRQQSLVREPTP